MIKTFLLGAVLGIVGVLVALNYVPVVDQHREASIISVMRNGGNSESFHINVPMDRIMIGAQGRLDDLLELGADPRHSLGEPVPPRTTQWIAASNRAEKTPLTPRM